MSFRIRETGQVITEGEFRSLHNNVSFPAVLTPEILNDFGVDPIMEGAQPTVTENQYVRSAGIEQDSNGNWVTKYESVDYTPEEIAARLEARRQGMIVSAFQAKAALLQAGLLSQVETLVSDPATDPLVKLAWNSATEWRRLSPMVASLATQLNLSDTQLDDLFANASLIAA